jgi:hypothetical protein
MRQAVSGGTAPLKPKPGLNGPPAGAFDKVSLKHLQRYLNEFSFRFNNRKAADLFGMTVRRMALAGNLPYAKLMDKKYSTGILGMILMGFAALFPVASPESMGQSYWRAIVVVVFLLGVACFLWQARILTRADKRTEERLSQIAEALKRLAPPAEEISSTPPPVNETLSMRILRSTILPESWVRPLVDDLYRVQAPKAEFDYLCELNIVNQSDTPITLEKFSAVAKVANREWEPVKFIPDLSAYQTKVGDDTYSRKDLANLQEKINELPLQKGVGHRGWVGFRFEAASDELRTPVQIELFAIDAAGNRHETIIPAQPGHFDDEVTYSIKNLRGE